MNVLETGYTAYGERDDLVLAVVIGVWWASEPSAGVAAGFKWGMEYSRVGSRSSCECGVFGA